MATALDTAKYLLILASGGPEADAISNLRLQKLLYYVQGWSLALRNKPMFPDPIQAWAHGPVVPTVYHRLKTYGPAAIPLDAIRGRPLGASESSLASAVWDAYKEFSALKLREMTHNEAPWIKARGTCGADDLCTRSITHTSMRAFFSEASKKK